MRERSVNAKSINHKSSSSFHISDLTSRKKGMGERFFRIFNLKGDGVKPD